MFLKMRKQLCDLTARSISDKRGSTAIEFVFVLPLFLALFFAQIAIGVYFFTSFSMEFAVEEASRQIRTGQAQTRETPMIMEEFKEAVCQRLPYADCDNNLRVFAVEFAGGFESIVIPQCLDEAGGLVPDPPGEDSVPGERITVVLVLACYEWTLPNVTADIAFGSLGALRLGNMPNGSTLIQAMTTFRTEDYY